MHWFCKVSGNCYCTGYTTEICRWVCKGWTGLLDSPLTSTVVYWPGHIENTSHARQDATSFPGRARDEDITDAKQQSRETQSQSIHFCASWNYTHKRGLASSSGIWKHAGWPSMIMQIRIDDLVFNYSTYTRTYVWNSQNKLLVSPMREVSFLFW